MEYQNPPNYNDINKEDKHQPVNVVNINVNEERKVNHMFHGLMTIITCGCWSFCWIGACIGCCPTCN